MSKIPSFKFFTKTKFSVSDVNKYYVGVKPQPTLNCVGFIGKRSIKNLQCHPELVSGSSHRQKCVTICTVSGKEVLDKVGWAFSPTLKYCWDRNPNLQKAISYVSRNATRHVRGDLVPAFTLAEVFLPYYLSPRRIAFTLAEVLITLGIIGVVAAMTLPTLINDYKAKETVTRLKKAYSMLNQAYVRALNDNGPLYSWGLVNSTNPEVDPDTGKLVLSEISEANENLFWSKMLPYLQAMKTDLGKQKLYIYQYKYLGGSDDNNDLIPRLILNDGVILAGGTISNISCAKKAKCGDFPVDINGLAGPNVIGRDIFMFYILNDRIVPAGGSDESSISIRTFSDYCLRNDAKNYNGYGCAAWVIYNENMDYLKCDGLSWSGKHKCK